MIEQQEHLVNGVSYKSESGLYRMVVEIPAGTNEKWQTDPVTSEFYHDKKDGKPRIINFLPYPMNYGFIPQTLLPKSKGGDGDPLDIITLAPAQPRGTVTDVRIIGALKLVEDGEEDTKVVALIPGNTFDGVKDISELLMRYPGAIEIVRLWFEGYKGAGSFLFNGYANHNETMGIIEAQHAEWQEYYETL